MTTNKPMTGEQLDELMTVAVNMQRDAETDCNRPSAMFAYAVQVAVIELRKVRDDAAELEQQLAESHRALRAETTAHENLQMQVEKLAAENGQMLRLLTDISENHEEYVNQDEYLYAGVPMDYVSEINAYVSRDVEAENPFKETDAYLAEVRATAITDALEKSSDFVDTDCVMDRLDISYEDAGLRTAGAIELHDALVEFAAKLRKGVQS
ncbi:TPA: hypothetical protein ACYZ6U_000320 [Escherichia coli]|uniref:hypothetical protein n=1 Tax=Escherichia coli TaxID=562 RepID=UPI000BB82158|nr:hypothetical protein [Escherichia coli]EFO0495856.1 hypothetical protein [Escherichia coli]EGO4719213.1 hypothetical protein [Escherichia coli]EHP6582807.1 hypothetical protein [Escherichia coli]EKM4516351.1 hypothetical protein [Escherichia coli]ELN8631415.1 hypothetical protein [Escherichia coli]